MIEPDAGASIPARLPEAALVVPVPEAEALVGAFRLRFDSSAAAGVPAHITVNYPFTPHFSRPDDARRVLARLFSTRRAFPFSFSEIQTFPDVVYLAPDPPGPFVDLIQDVWGLFPDSPPYGGAFELVIPHLTIAQSGDSATLHAALDEITGHVRPHLPLSCKANEVLLLDNVGGHWVTRHSFALPSD